MIIAGSVSSSIHANWCSQVLGSCTSGFKTPISAHLVLETKGRLKLKISFALFFFFGGGGGGVCVSDVALLIVIDMPATL